MTIAVFMSACGGNGIVPEPVVQTIDNEIWNNASSKWNNETTSYTGDLFIWAYRTEYFIDNTPSLIETGDEPDWQYRVYDVKFKKGDKILLTCNISGNEDHYEDHNGDMISKYLSYTMQYATGTVFSYGHFDQSYIYINFPYLTDEQFGEMLIPDVWQGALYMISVCSRKEYYKRTPEELADIRGLELDDVSIKKIMDSYEHYLYGADITQSGVPLYERSDYYLDSNGWLSLRDDISGPENAYRLTVSPEKIFGGITKIELFFNKETDMLTGLHEYESGILVRVLLFSNMQYNIQLPDSLWDDVFKDKSLSEK